MQKEKYEQKINHYTSLAQQTKKKLKIVSFIRLFCFLFGTFLFVFLLNKNYIPIAVSVFLIFTIAFFYTVKL